MLLKPWKNQSGHCIKITQNIEHISDNMNLIKFLKFYQYDHFLNVPDCYHSVSDKNTNNLQNASQLIYYSMLHQYFLFKYLINIQFSEVTGKDVPIYTLNKHFNQQKVHQYPHTGCYKCTIYCTEMLLTHNIYLYKTAYSFE